MTARYWTLVSQDLLGSGRFAETAANVGLLLIEAGEAEPDRYMRWCLVEDKNAPADLEGKRVELQFTQSTVIEVTGRLVINDSVSAPAACPDHAPGERCALR